MTLDLGAPAAVLTRLCAGVRDDQLAHPTPCPDLDVGGLLAHLIGASTAFRDGAAKVAGPTTSTPPGPSPLPDDWREQLPIRLAELAEAWRVDGAWQGETTVGGVTLPAEQHAAFANDELVIHGWDLAVSTRQPYEPPPANLEAVWELLAGVPDDPQARTGLFGPRLPIADDAPLLERALAYAGRDAGWNPPTG